MNNYWDSFDVASKKINQNFYLCFKLKQNCAVEFVEIPIGWSPLLCGEIQVKKKNKNWKQLFLAGQRTNAFCPYIHFLLLYFPRIFFLSTSSKERKISCVCFICASNEHKNIDQWTYFFAGNKSTWFSLFFFRLCVSSTSNWMNSGWHTKKTADNHLVEWLVVTCLTQK